MITETQKHEPETRPVFKFLAGFFGVFSVITGCFTVVFAFQSTGSALWHWIGESSLFLLMGASFIHTAFTGRWGLRR